MGINKMALSLAVVGVLGASSALAEQNGAFIGVQAGFGTSNYKIDANPSAEADFKGLRYGIMFGQKGFERLSLFWHSLSYFGRLWCL